MNKYQEALYAIPDKIVMDNFEIDFSEERKIFQELIDKETPKKVKIEKWNDVVVGLVTEYHCPNCNKAVDLLSEKYPNFYKRPCCPNCGQKLDWSKE